MTTTPRDDGGPAFPVPHLVTIHGEIANAGAVGGMTLRDYFAAKAMAAMVGNFYNTWRGVEDAQCEGDSDSTSPHRDMLLDRNGVTGEYDGAKEVAADAYIIADAMLAARRAK